MRFGPGGSRPKISKGPDSNNLSALLSKPRLLHTDGVAMPASRFLCEHLHQNALIWACISRIHAQVPVLTTGQLTKSLRQQISCGTLCTVRVSANVVTS